MFYKDYYSCLFKGWGWAVDFKILVSLQNDKFLVPTKLFKAFSENTLSVAKMIISVFDIGENNLGKGENSDYCHFCPFRTIFSTGFFRTVVNGNTSEGCTY